MFEYEPFRRSQAVDSFSSSPGGSESLVHIDIPNPYCWLEDPSSEEAREFVARQNAALDGYLASDTSTSAVRERLMTLLQSSVQGEVISQSPQSAGDFYLLRVSGRGRALPITVKISKNHLRAFSQAPDSSNKFLSAQKPLEVFHDESAAGGSLLSSGVSESGQYWAYSTSVKGSDWGVIRIKEIKSGHIFLDEIRNTKFNTIIKPIIWWRDLGFFYQYWHHSDQQRARPQLRYHSLGTPQGDDKVIWEDKDHPGYCFWLEISKDGRFAFLSIYSAGQTCKVQASRIISRDERPELEHCADLSATFDYKWEYIGKVIRDERPLDIFWTDRNNGEVVGFCLDNPTPPEVLLVKGIDTNTLKLALAVGNGYILAIRSVDVRDRLEIISLTDGKVTTVDTPMDCVFKVAYNSKDQDIFIIESSFIRPFSLWHLCSAGLSSSLGHSTPLRPVPIKLYPESGVNATGVSQRQVFYSSLDGTKVPMFIVSKDLSPVTPDTPVLLYVYGGFGISLIPHFRPDLLLFMESFRGILAFANIRGGGEYGRSWHFAACKEKRQKALDDIHGALKYINYTLRVKNKPILMGESMGALNSMSAIIQQPSLVSAAILNAGPFDVLHKGKLGLGMRGLEDIGDENVPREFAAILLWSPLENVQQGQQYPPVLFTAGDQDDLVSHAHSCKMAVTLQHVQSDGHGNSAVHLRVSENIGHGGAVSAVKQAIISVERLLWLKTTLGLTFYDQ